MIGALPRTGTADIVLAAEHVDMVFRRKGTVPNRALADVSIAARAGRVTGLVGPDGAGKTTLLRLAAGLLVPTRGSFTVLGHDSVSEPDAIRRRIGYLPQKFGLYEDLTVQENLDLSADLQGVPRSARADRYERLMSMTGLGPFTRRLAGRLSGGMKQKLGLACGLVKSPDLLLLDEPTVGVDPVSRRDLWDIVYELVADAGIGVLLSTSYLDEAERCDHVVLLHEGRTLAEGPPAQFHRRVRERVWRADPAPGTGPRDLQSALVKRPDVVDATIRSGRVRVVLDRNVTDRPQEVFADLAAASVPAEPVFEDAFVDLLGEAGAGRPLREGAPVAAPPATAAPRDEVVVRVRDLTKRFGSFVAVRRIGFEVRRGEIFGLLGPNGAGKSTTFRMLCGLLPATDGEIRVAGHDLRRSGAKARSRLGYVAQKFSLYQQLPVIQNLRFYGRAYGLSGRRLTERVDRALDDFDLRSRRGEPAGDLPGGYRRRLAMAASMLHEPDILFLDEPTSGADPLARREFWLRINGFARSGVTVIVTTHFLEEAEYCDRLLILSQGTALAEGTPERIRALARSDDHPEPTVEDAFIVLAEGRVTPDEPGANRG